MQRLPARFEPFETRLNRRFGFNLWTLLAAILLLFLTTDSASATCGDYLRHRIQVPSSSSPQQRSPFANSSQPDDVRTTGYSATSGGAKPCRGLQCQRRSSIPAPITPQGMSPEFQDRWNDWNLIVISPPVQLTKLTPVAESVDVAVPNRRLDRPPIA